MPAFRSRFCLTKRAFETREQSYRNSFSDLPLLRDTNESENYLSWFQCEQHCRSIVFPRFPSRVYTHSRLPEPKLYDSEKPYFHLDKNKFVLDFVAKLSKIVRVKRPERRQTAVYLVN
ncbi:unnamed protein product [Lasius platythorax]|uniref:Uncharacterized protein n=1 Tax=Lasius platythorax TaxID=488582 RepID=A0AAV2NR38_9HYME